ncbi:GNAT family N-acetyltransferase [Candidatus Peregrinibacteria bacterium]|jgi:L-amino acid N-acyltransferase YncA|nr:GNAT family N-acetyltransferase [Candidatus Peregrinibacteria bacterium]MBT7483653.1 GNAT family N-acetyltransferase [Candidatus Peregrinibacteria bacterium]MBT7702712.1 GNAT family N-acetyltransferase [Candidatus Peregrinibacteria bacterium]
MPPTITKADLNLFLSHQPDILAIERDLIENSSSAYLIDEEDEMDFMVDAFRHGGYAYLVMENKKLIGFMVVGPLDDGTDLPDSVTRSFPVQNCLHIKMMYIKDTSKGMGSLMMEKLIKELDKDKWKYLFVRTWVDPPNEGAISFYTKRAGVEMVPDSIVEPTKTRQYFAKEV